MTPSSSFSLFFIRSNPPVLSGSNFIQSHLAHSFTQVPLPLHHPHLSCALFAPDHLTTVIPVIARRLCQDSQRGQGAMTAGIANCITQLLPTILTHLMPAVLVPPFRSKLEPAMLTVCVNLFGSLLCMRGQGRRPSRAFDRSLRYVYLPFIQLAHDDPAFLMLGQVCIHQGQGTSKAKPS